MLSTYSLREFKTALLRNIDVYLEEGDSYYEDIRTQLSFTQDKETMMQAYRSVTALFRDTVYCEIDEEYNRLCRYEDILKRWELSGDKPRRRDSLERLIVNFDLNNYAPPAKKGFLS